MLVGVSPVVLGALLGVLSTALLGALTTGRQLAVISTRLASLEAQFRDIAEWRVRSRRTLTPEE